MHKKIFWLCLVTLFSCTFSMKNTKNIVVTFNQVSNKSNKHYLIACNSGDKTLCSPGETLNLNHTLLNVVPNKDFPVRALVEIGEVTSLIPEKKVLNFVLTSSFLLMITGNETTSYKLTIGEQYIVHSVIDKDHIHTYALFKK